MGPITNTHNLSRRHVCSADDNLYDPSVCEGAHRRRPHISARRVLQPRRPPLTSDIMVERQRRAPEKNLLASTMKCASTKYIPHTLYPRPCGEPPDRWTGFSPHGFMRRRNTKEGGDPHAGPGLRTCLDDVHEALHDRDVGVELDLARTVEEEVVIIREPR
jgi:hypothetical protein